jgi:predicted DNA binding CopG/RHH family protein
MTPIRLGPRAESSSSAEEVDRLRLDELEEWFEARYDTAEGREERSTIRWPGRQLAVIRVAAARMGAPYQVYIKMAAMRQALADLTLSEKAIVEARRQLGDETKVP